MPAYGVHFRCSFRFTIGVSQFLFITFSMHSAMVYYTSPFQLPLLRPSAIFSISAPLVSSLLASYPAVFQVLVIYDNIRIVSRIQSRLVFREMGSGFLSFSPSLPLLVALSCRTSK